jgi:hypothetical protein
MVFSSNQDIFALYYLFLPKEINVESKPSLKKGRDKGWVLFLCQGELSEGLKGFVFNLALG